jgi:hypothetical protein
MWRLWSRTLERLGALRFVITQTSRVTVGSPSGLDALGGARWKLYAKPEKLFDVWGPPAGSPWLPFHSVPLFAALDRIPASGVGPAPDAAPLLPPHARPGEPKPAWCDADTLVMLELPGPAAVEAAVWLVRASGCQPVCTFDNWPHPKGLLKPEQTLAALLRYASTMADLRERISLDMPPLWICESDRLGRYKGTGQPGDFDNRYYLDDSSLPGPALLRRHGIRRIVCVAASVEPALDLESYFADLLAAGIDVYFADIADPALERQRFSAPPKPRQPPRSGFQRSAAGGFGSEVPQPSEGGGG